MTKQEMLEAYLFEECKKCVYWSKHGFISYTIEGEELHVWDIFIEPKARGKRRADRLYEDIETLASFEGCSYTTCLVRDHGCEKERSHKIRLLAERGFVITRIEGRDTFLKKEI